MAYSEINVYIHPSRWNGGTLPRSVREELVARYNNPIKNQTITTEAPIVTIRTYD